MHLTIALVVTAFGPLSPMCHETFSFMMSLLVMPWNTSLNFFCPWDF